MRIGWSAQLALEMWHAADAHLDERRAAYVETAMLLACNAIDGTARARSGGGKGNNAKRFTQLIRDELDIFEVVGMPGIDLVTTRFPYPFVETKSPGKPDIADVLYYVHRCAHGHGDTVPENFELTPREKVAGNTCIRLSDESIRLPESAILGLIAIAVLAPENAGEHASGAMIPWTGGVLDIDEWWGQRDKFREVVRSGGYNVYKLNSTPPDGSDTMTLADMVEFIRRAATSSGPDS